MRFKNKVLMIGYGSVAKCTLPILLKHIDIPFKNITIIDLLDKRRELAPWIKKGVKYFQEKVTPININQLLSKHVSAGGLVIDLAWNIECLDMLSWCHDNKVLYINTSVEEWDPYVNIHKKSPLQKSLYSKQMQISDMVSRWENNSTTALLDHGANPGLISHFTKKGIMDIALKCVRDKFVEKAQVKNISRFIQIKNFARLAMELGIKVIHISERDTQITHKTK